MKSTLCTLLLGIIFCGSGHAQSTLAYRQLVREGNTLLSNGKQIEAEIAFRKALDMFPEGSEASFNLGNCLFVQGKYDQAVPFLEASLEDVSDPRLRSRMLYSLGTTHLALEDQSAAAEALKEALQMDPSNEYARHNFFLAQLANDPSEENQDDPAEDKSSEEKKEQQDQSSGNDEADQESDESPEDVPPSDQPPSKPMTPEEADQMLRRLEFMEQQVQEQVKQRQEPGKIRGEKDW